MGRFSEAVIAARRAAVLHSSPETARLLGRILQDAGRGAEAEHVLYRAHRRWPGAEGLALSLANSLDAGAATQQWGVCPSPHGSPTAAAGHPQRATEVLLRALDATQGDGWALHLRAGQLLAGQDEEEADRHFRAAVDAQPDRAAGWTNYGAQLVEWRLLARAVSVLAHATELDPTVSAAWNNLGLAHSHRGDNKAAERAFDRATHADPANADAWTHLAFARFRSLDIRGAVAAYKRSAELGRDVRASLAHVRQFGCDWSRHVQDSRQLADLIRQCTPADAGQAPSGFEALAAGLGPELQRRAAWCRAEALVAEVRGHVARPQPPPPSQKAPLRVAYVVGDWSGTHPLAMVSAPLPLRHNRSRVAPQLFPLTPSPGDPTYEHLVSRCPTPAVLAPLASDDAAAVAVRRGGAHVAVDVSGWTLGTRMGLFARRVAPLQLHYLGFIASTGARFIDGYVADPVSVAVETSGAEFEEPLVLLPRGTPFFAPGALHDRARQAAVSTTATARRAAVCRLLARAGAAASALLRAPPRFFSPNSLYKLCPLLLSAWANLLRRLPGSTLAILAVPADGVRSVRRELASRGVSPRRVVPWDRVDPAQHALRLQREVDLGLDAARYGAGASALDLLFAGIPMVTIRGRTTMQRVSAGLNAAAGNGALVRRAAEPATLSPSPADRSPARWHMASETTRTLPTPWRPARRRAALGTCPRSSTRSTCSDRSGGAPACSAGRTGCRITSAC